MGEDCREQGAETDGLLREAGTGRSTTVTTSISSSVENKIGKQPNQLASVLPHVHGESKYRHCPTAYLQNSSAHTVGTRYSGLYEEGEVEHINVSEWKNRLNTLTCEREPSEL